MGVHPVAISAVAATVATAPAVRYGTASSLGLELPGAGQEDAARPQCLWRLGLSAAALYTIALAIAVRWALWRVSRVEPGSPALPGQIVAGIARIGVLSWC
jgi:hypothetical protein